MQLRKDRVWILTSQDSTTSAVQAGPRCSLPSEQVGVSCLPQTRQLVKDGFLVEMSESSRKLRHVFLFTDVLLCAKLKKTSAG